MIPSTLADAIDAGLDDFSGVLLVRDANRTVHTLARGTRDGLEPITIATRFGVASVTKMFTAVAIARAVERGLLSLDTPVAPRLPASIASLAVDTTVDHLLTHRSGIGDYLEEDDELPFADLPVASLASTVDFVPVLQSVARLSAPGERYHYSSAGFLLLGIVLESVFEAPYPEIIAAEITEPTGLSSTFFPRTDAWPTDTAIGVLRDGRQNLRHIPVRGGPDGGIVTSASDLMRFFDALRSGELLQGRTIDHFWEPVSAESSQMRYGRGFCILRDGTGWVGHTGSDPGVSALVTVDPIAGRVIVALSNRDGHAYRAHGIARSWLSDPIS